MKTFPVLPFRFALVLLVVAVSVVRADDSLLNARKAQSLLGPEVWSEVIRIDNEQPTARYPRTLHALVFELGEILWFYTGSEGTQSLSLYRGRLEADKADFAPLLRDLAPGFTRWTVVAEEGPAPPRPMRLANGCFIESVVRLRDRLVRGGEALRPKLLSFYVGNGTTRKGHTVLAYETRGRIEVVDSAQAGKRFSFPVALANNPVGLAEALQGSRVDQARMLPVDWPSVRAGYYSTVGAAGAGMASSG